MECVKFHFVLNMELNLKPSNYHFFRAKQNLSFEMGSTYLSVFNVAITVFLFNFEPDFF